MNCRVCGRQFDPHGVPSHGARAQGRLRPGRLRARGERRRGRPPEEREPAPDGRAGAAHAARRGAGCWRACRRHDAAESVRPQLVRARTSLSSPPELPPRSTSGCACSAPTSGRSPSRPRTPRTPSARRRCRPRSTSRRPLGLPQPESAVRGAGSQPATSPATSGDRHGRSPPTARTSRAERVTTGGPVVRPSRRPTPPAPPPRRAEPDAVRARADLPRASSPPDDRVPGPTPPTAVEPEQPALPAAGDRP